MLSPSTYGGAPLCSAAHIVPSHPASFLKEFSKRTWKVNDQIVVINDFLDVRLSVSLAYSQAHWCTVHLGQDEDERDLASRLGARV
jgi:hypothetical protein